MGINVQGGFDSFVTEALAYDNRRKSHFYKQAGVGMAQIVNTNFFNAGFHTSLLHFIIYRLSADCEQPMVFVCFPAKPDYFIGYLLRQGDNPIALFGFRGLNELFALINGIAFVYGNTAGILVKILRGQGEKLSDTDTAEKQ